MKNHTLKKHLRAIGASLLVIGIIAAFIWLMATFPNVTGAACALIVAGVVLYSLYEGMYNLVNPPFRR